jgi:glycine dehydrogenase
MEPNSNIHNIKSENKKMNNNINLPYNPEQFPRELTKYYISADEKEISQMLNDLNLKTRDELFEHISEDIQFKKTPHVTERLEYQALAQHMFDLSKKNRPKTCFIGDGLKHYHVPDIVPFVCDIRGLTTAYTPYQPERSQGTLMTLWMYASGLRMLTGFEAINASLYERSTCLYEAINTALRLKKKTNTILVSGAIYPGDIEVLNTLGQETAVELKYIPVDASTGLTDQKQAEKMAEDIGSDLAGIVFSQQNNMGVLEDIHFWTDFARERKISSIGIIDPLHLANNGLLPPAKWGSDAEGCTMIVGEGQHLCLAPNMGGPGLGIFGIRYNEKNKNAIRSTAGRYVGKAKDEKGQDCLAMVLSTREQHIRREKATSNICSNQSFVASIAGAALFARGEKGLEKACSLAWENAQKMASLLSKRVGIKLAYPETPFFNEFTLELSDPVAPLIEKARQQGLHLGSDLTGRANDQRNLLMLFFSDNHESADLEKLLTFLKDAFPEEESGALLPPLPSNYLRQEKTNFPDINSQTLKDFYVSLGEQNVSPDDNIYPLGSCTMKYNPYINDWAAGLAGFTDIHPQAPEQDAQGSLELLYGIQEMFKDILGLPGVVTQPVAGAQGELVGLKMFQAYHRDNGNEQTKNIILIPRSAHGTNPATATMAGYENKVINGEKVGIVILNALESGRVDMNEFREVIQEYGSRIAGLMVTNPNTSGIFETEFKEMADLIHSVDGLVYMDGANMNAIASWVDLGKLGVDAVHQNLHKTWTIPHGGGGPGDAVVGVSEKLIPYIPGIQVKNENGVYSTFKTEKSIGSFHRHMGNFAHKVRAYTYIKALGGEGVREMSAIAVLSARYLYQKINDLYPTLPSKGKDEARMHEFILTLSPEMFKSIEDCGIPKTQVIAKVGKLFLDFGMHAPTVAFPEPFGLMIEPTESFSKEELDRFLDILKAIHQVLSNNPEVLKTVPHFTPVSKVDEVAANKNLILSENIKLLPKVLKNKVNPGELKTMPVNQIIEKIIEASKEN